MSVATSTARRTTTAPGSLPLSNSSATPPAAGAAAPAAVAGAQSTPSSYNKAAPNPYSTGSSAAMPAQTSKQPAAKPGMKREGAAVAGEWSMDHKQSAKVQTSRGQGKSADTVKKEMKGGTKIVEKSVSTEAKKEVKKGFERTVAESRYGTVKDKGEIGASVKAGAKADLKITSKGVEFNAEAKAEAKAGVGYNITFKSKEFTIQGQKVRADFSLNLSAAAVAEAGGKVELAMTVGPPPKAIVKLGGKAFAGVQAGAELTGSLVWVKDKGNEVALAKGTIGASVSAGIGASAGLEVGYADGKMSLEAYAGVTLGVGASIKAKAELDVKAIGEFAKVVGEKGVKELVGSLINPKDIDALTKNLLKKWQELPGAIAKKVGSDAVNAGKDMDQATKEAAKDLAQQARAGKKLTEKDVIKVVKEKMGNSNNVILKGAGGAVEVFSWLNGWP